MPQVHLEPLIPDRVDEAAAVLGRAFVTNPLHEAAFGRHEEARNRTFFRRLLRLLRGPKIVAFDGERIVGAMHWSRSDECQMHNAAKLSLVPFMLRAFGVVTSVRLATWFGLWARHDKSTSVHLHLGPIGAE